MHAGRRRSFAQSDPDHAPRFRKPILIPRCWAASGSYRFRRAPRLALARPSSQLAESGSVRVEPYHYETALAA
jgi:hypothetical protein